MHCAGLKKRLINGGGWAFLTMLAWEGVESLLEYAIAYLISSAITLLVIKVLTTFLIVTAVQGMIIRPLKRFLLSFIRKIIIDKKGEKQEMEKFKFILGTVWKYLKANKCSLVVVLCSAIIGLSGSSVIDVEKLPAITVGSATEIPAVIQEEDVVAEEVVWEKEPIYATETIYGKAIFATETIYEEGCEPVYATETIYKEGCEPIYATETIYGKEPVIADKLVFIANAVIYEEDGETVKYEVGDYVPNAEASMYIDKLDMFNKGEVIFEGEILFEKGSLIKAGEVLFEKGSLVSEGTIKFNEGDYIGNEILYNVGDVLVEGTKKHDIGDILIPAGTILEESRTLPPTNITPYIYYAILAIGMIISGVFFEKPDAYAQRKEDEKAKKQEAELKKQAAKEIADEERAKTEAEQKAEQEALLQQAEAEKRARLEKIKAEIIRSEN